MTMDPISRLIVQTALSDRNAFDALYQATSAKLFGVCLRVLKDRAEAEEALQEIYIKIWHKADRYAVTDLSPMTWLIAVARHHAIDRLRARKTGRTVELNEAVDVADSAANPEQSALATSERARLDECLDELEAARADAVRSAYISGDSYAELAARHNVPLNTMRTWLRRSLIKLRDCLQQ